MKLFMLTLFAASLAPAGPVGSQVPTQLSAVVKCRSEGDEQARLRCYDAAVAALENAASSGNLVVVDREDVRRTRRSLFGFSLPKLPFFSGDDSQGEEQEQIETRIRSVRGLGYGKWQFDLGENGVWQTTEGSTFGMTPRPGQSIRIRKGALGSYFVTVEGDRPVKGMRIR